MLFYLNGDVELMSECTASAFKISGAISSHMVFQRNAGIRVWGTADTKGSVIFGEFMGETASSKVSASGDWLLEFSARDTQTVPQIMKIYTETGETEILEDILIGDVYLITGQSNAEMTMGACIQAYPEDQGFLYRDNMRIFAQNREYIVNHPETWGSPQEDVVDPDWRWQKSADEAVYAFSALGYYFGRMLADTLPELPIGLIMGAAGGAQIIELMPPETAAALGYSNSATVGASGFYNTLLHPFIKMPVRAAVYYQGESESVPSCFSVYGRDLEALVRDLRKAWGIPFKFYNVQLSTHGAESEEMWPSIGEIRAIQYAAADTIPDYYVVASFDSGKKDNDPDFAHPYYKKVPGERLAKLVLSEEYGLLDKEYASGPYVVKAEKAGAYAELTFKYTADGLKTCDGCELKGFQTEKNGVRKNAAASIAGKNTVRVELESGVDSICYAIQVQPDKAGANLANSADIPAPAFRVRIV